jgi:hypothetical protein
MIPIIGGAAVVAKYANKARRAVNAVDPPVQIFRNVDAREFDSIAGALRFGTGPGEDGRRVVCHHWRACRAVGDLLNKGQGITVETRLPRSVADRLHHEPGKLDGVGPGYYADEGQLDLINKEMDGIRVWP